MYESPIMAMVSDITTEMRHEQDREIMNAILSVGINVDKDELVKALRYDRQQYDKGYSEGYADAKADDVRGVGKWIEVAMRIKCSVCGTDFNDEVTYCSDCYRWPWNYCPNCGAKIEEVN